VEGVEYKKNLNFDTKEFLFTVELWLLCVRTVEVIIGGVKGNNVLGK
jgi:hypothetical protein